MKFFSLISVFFFIITTPVFAQHKTKDTNPIASGLKFRSIGPALKSGRVSDFAVNPQNHSEYYVSFAGGHIWKTTNNGTTFKPVFDKQGAYSIGCLKRDPKNPNIIWAGTGENNHQRSVSYGDGIYKSTDGGKSWKNLGLKDSRQIGMIAIDPRNTDIVFVAAEGSVWGPGGDRGLYRTDDAGKTWKKVLHISENTGVNNVLIDPENPDVMYATSEQRRRHVHIRIGGGPESAIWKSTDAGKTWRKIEKGLPPVDKGGIGIAISPVNHNYVYAMVEAAMGKGGFFRSTDQGESWERMSDYNTSGQYFGEIVCDPVDVHTIYATETYSKVSHDDGKTWTRIGNNNRHVDDHAIWIDPGNTCHFIIGGDGGVYETFDYGKTYIHKTNLPVTQFYRVAVDEAYPFYNIYGGTQDNNSIGGPSRTLYDDGINRCDWITTIGGDGYWQAIDPTNPDIVYSEYQYGNIFRFDKKSGERISIKPLPREGENTYKWNWNTPFILSPHNHKRLYMAANKIFRSDDRGDSWQVISDDITRQLSRDKWPVMGRYWSVDAVAKNVSTSLFGMGVSLCESPVQEGLLYVGTDDGLIQMTENNGKNWQKTGRFPGVPEYTYVSDIAASKFDKNVVFASFDNRKRDDFTPYILRSNDKGKTWKSIRGNLPENGTVHSIEQDPVNPDLLFAGTEFGVFYTLNGGKKWTALKNGIPTISVRDIAIQKRENDLVLATFGRGFYVLDDYSPLRFPVDSLSGKKAMIFPVKDALLYVQKKHINYGYGSTFYHAKNPDFGATFTYYLKETPKTKQELRRQNEKERIKNKSHIPIPRPKELYDEKTEIKPFLEFVITDAQGNEIRKLITPAQKGVHRITWNLTYPWKSPVKPIDSFDPMKINKGGILVTAGNYFVSMQLVQGDKITPLVKNTAFKVKRFRDAALPEADEAILAKHVKKLAELARVTWGTAALSNELLQKVNSLNKAILESENIPGPVRAKGIQLQKKLLDIKWRLEGEKPVASYEEIQPAPMAIFPRLYKIIYTHNQSTSPVTQNEKEGYRILKKEVNTIIQTLKQIANTDIPVIEKELYQHNSPWTSGHIPEFKD